MRRSVPENRSGMVVPSAVEGSLARFSPTAPAKCTSPPKPRLTVFPLPFQSGLSGECFGKLSAGAAVWWVVAGGGGGELEPPEMNAK